MRTDALRYSERTSLNVLPLRETLLLREKFVHLGPSCFTRNQSSSRPQHADKGWCQAFDEPERSPHQLMYEFLFFFR